MIILALDTSGKIQSVALSINGKVSSECVLEAGPSHSETLLASVDSVLSHASLKLNDVDLFALAVGPGSFTGLRVGISMVKAFCQIKARPVAPVSTLMAMAFPFLQEDYLIVSGLDAGLGEVFAGAYQKTEVFPQTLIEDRLFKLENLSEKLQSFPQEKYFIGSFFKNNFDFLKSNFLCKIEPKKNTIRPLASAVASLGEMMFRGQQTISGLQLKPNYLRRSEAENRLFQTSKALL